MSAARWSVFADPSTEGRWGWLAYRADGTPAYGTAPSQIEAAQRAKRAAEQPVDRAAVAA